VLSIEMKNDTRRYAININALARIHSLTHKRPTKLGIIGTTHTG
jgi:hypothetical protein